MTSNNCGLTAEQTRQFDEQGYLLLKNRVPRAALNALQKVFEGVVEKEAEEWLAEGRIEDKAEGLPFETRYARLREQVPASFSNSWRRVLVGQATYQMWRLPELVEIARSLLGNELHAHGTWNGRPRPPRQTVATIGWHQDAAYYRRYQDGDGRIVSMWMPLVPVDAQAGCLQIMPGSNHTGLLPTIKMGVDLVGVTEEALQPFSAVTCDMQPGDVLVFDQYTAHRALDNESDYVRWSFDIRFCSADNERVVSQDNGGYLCFSQSDPQRVQSLEEWAAHYDYEGEF